MRSFPRFFILAIVLAIPFAGIGIFFATNSDLSARVLTPSLLRTNAPPSILSSTLQDVYHDLRLRHFMDGKGNVTFANGSSTDTTSNESVSKLEGIVTGKKYFDDPKGNQIMLTWTTEPEIGTLLSWEYQGDDPQIISIAIQKSLASKGVSIE